MADRDQDFIDMVGGSPSPSPSPTGTPDRDQDFIDMVNAQPGTARQASSTPATDRAGVTALQVLNDPNLGHRIDLGSYLRKPSPPWLQRYEEPVRRFLTTPPQLPQGVADYTGQPALTMANAALGYATPANALLGAAAAVQPELALPIYGTLLAQQAPELAPKVARVFTGKAGPQEGLQTGTETWTALLPFLHAGAGRFAPAPPGGPPPPPPGGPTPLGPAEWIRRYGYDPNDPAVQRAIARYGYQLPTPPPPLAPDVTMARFRGAGPEAPAAQEPSVLSEAEKEYRARTDAQEAADRLRARTAENEIVRLGGNPQSIVDPLIQKHGNFLHWGHMADALEEEAQGLWMVDPDEVEAHRKELEARSATPISTGFAEASLRGQQAQARKTGLSVKQIQAIEEARDERYKIVQALRDKRAAEARDEEPRLDEKGREIKPTREEINAQAIRDRQLFEAEQRWIQQGGPRPWERGVRRAQAAPQPPAREKVPQEAPPGAAATQPEPDIRKPQTAADVVNLETIKGSKVIPERGIDLSEISARDVRWAEADEDIDPKEFQVLATDNAGGRLVTRRGTPGRPGAPRVGERPGARLSPEEEEQRRKIIEGEGGEETIAGEIERKEREKHAARVQSTGKVPELEVRAPVGEEASLRGKPERPAGTEEPVSTGETVAPTIQTGEYESGSKLSRIPRTGERVFHRGLLKTISRVDPTNQHVYFEEGGHAPWRGGGTNRWREAVEIKKKEVKPRGARADFDAYGGDTTPVAKYVLDSGGLISRSTAKKSGLLKGNEALWNDPPELSHKSHNKIYSDAGRRPDVMASDLHAAGLLPDADVGTMYRALEGESQTVRAMAGERQAQAPLEKEALKRAAKQETQDRAFNDAQRRIAASGKAPPRIIASDLGVGDTVKVAGEEFMVKDFDPDTFTITMEDGERFGTQVLRHDDIILGEHTKMPVPPEVDYTAAGGANYNGPGSALAMAKNYIPADVNLGIGDKDTPDSIMNRGTRYVVKGNDWRAIVDQINKEGMNPDRFAGLWFERQQVADERNAAIDSGNKREIDAAVEEELTLMRELATMGRDGYPTRIFKAWHDAETRSQMDFDGLYRKAIELNGYKEMPAGKLVELKKRSDLGMQVMDRKNEATRRWSEAGDKEYPPGPRPPTADEVQKGLDDAVKNSEPCET